MARAHPALRGGVLGLVAAALFGASPPLAKLLLPEIGPLVLSALLYLGAGLVLVLARPRRADAEARLRRADALPLAGIAVFGGALAPLLLLVGLERVSGLTGALLLNLEAPFTILLAVGFFGDHLGKRERLAGALVVAGAVVLAHRPGELRADWIGTASIAGACLLWAIDNNLSQLVSLRDPVEIVRLKSLSAGSGMLLLALSLGHPLPGPALAASALALGAFSYGLSLIFDMHAIRAVGAAREAAYFATAPFLGALLSIPLLGDRPTPATGVAAVLMAGGVALLLLERHSHRHAHEELVHDHRHVHDEHHRHAHDGAVTEPHSHPHRHERLVHDHPHVPDLHHRHRHP